MEVQPPTDKLQEIKQRCFQRLNNERHELIRRRREASGYGTYSKRKENQVAPSDGKNVFTMPRNSLG